jgi:hypothetical protein
MQVAVMLTADTQHYLLSYLILNSENMLKVLLYMELAIKCEMRELTI